ncbi:hypothetical protein GEMRC1_008922 [Eukaryota sp. GEM-RC1]
MEFGSAIRDQDNLTDVSATIKSKNVGKVLVVMPINDAITAIFPGCHWALATYNFALNHLYFADSLKGKLFLTLTKDHVARASNHFHPHNLSVPQQIWNFVLYVIETLYKSINNQVLNADDLKYKLPGLEEKVQSLQKLVNNKDPKTETKHLEKAQNDYQNDIKVLHSIQR